MSVPSLKKHLIQSFTSMTMPNMSENNGNNVILVTAAGIIEGKLSTDSHSAKNESSEYFAGFVKESVKVYNEDYASPPIMGDDGCIVLVDAKLTALDGLCCTFGNLAVFFDQIIAASYGQVSLNAE